MHSYRLQINFNMEFSSHNRKISFKKSLKFGKLIPHEQKTQKINISNYTEILFDITNEKCLWLSTEEKIVYKLKVESNRKVGHVTSKIVPTHPSKCIKDKETVVSKTTIK